MYDQSASLYDLFYMGIKDYEAESNSLVDTVDRWSPGARTLLDVGCGTGVHLGYLAKTYEVAGLDLSPEMVEIARGRNPSVPIGVGDVLDMDLGRRFDLVTFLFSGIAYLRTAERLAQGVSRIASHLEPGGITIIDSWVRPDALDPTHFLSCLTAETEGLVAARVDRSEVREGISIVDMSFLVATRDRIDHFTERHELALFTRGDYESAFGSAGLEILDISEAIPTRDRFVAQLPV